MTTRRNFNLAVAAALAAPCAFAPAYPARPARLIIRFPSGGTTDILARMCDAVAMCAGIKPD